MDFSRRSFFQDSTKRILNSLFTAIAESEPTHGEESPAFLRPPGALPEKEFLETCTKCDACITVCPKWAVRRAGHELGDMNEGTPVILPELNPCWLCKDLPCIAACEPGALQPLEQASMARMGLAEISASQCFSASGSICEVCDERCPVRPKAVRFTRGQLPEIDADLCTGCGICAHLCPADAITITPCSESASTAG